MLETIIQIGELKNVVFRGDFKNPAINRRNESFEFIILDSIKNRRDGIDVFDFVAEMKRQIDNFSEFYAIKGFYCSDGKIRFRVNERDTNSRDQSYLNFAGKVEIVGDKSYVAKGAVIHFDDNRDVIPYDDPKVGKFEMRSR